MGTRIASDRRTDDEILDRPERSQCKCVNPRPDYCLLLCPLGILVTIKGDALNCRIFLAVATSEATDARS